MHRTNIEMPEEIKVWVKENGMTYRGAFLMGIQAIKERKQWNVEKAELQANVEKYRRAWLDAQKQLDGEHV